MDEDDKKIIDDEATDKLLSLSRIKVPADEKKKISEDLNSILGYVQELEKISADHISLDPKSNDIHPLRDDTLWDKDPADREFLVNSFKEVENDKLKIPPILSK